MKAHKLSIITINIVVIIILSRFISLPIYSASYPTHGHNVVQKYVNNGPSIQIKFVRDKILPHKLKIIEGKLLSGTLENLYTLYDFVLISSSGSKIDLIIGFEVETGGTLLIESSLSSSNITTSVLAYSYKALDFIYLGSLSDKIYYISNEYVTSDGELIIRIKCGAATDFNLTLWYSFYYEDPIIKTYRTELIQGDNYPIVKLSILVDKPKTWIIFLNLSKLWIFSWCSRDILWNHTLPGFYAMISGVYDLFFLAYDYWKFYYEKEIRFIFTDYYGNYIPVYKLPIFYQIERDLVNESNWIYSQNVTIYNPLDISLYNVSIAFELNSSNFNFFATNRDLSDLKIIYDGMELPHYISYWDGTRAVIETKVPYIPANSNVTLTILYGNYREKVLPKKSDAKYILAEQFDSLSNWSIINGYWYISYSASFKSNVTSNNVSNPDTLKLNMLFMPQILLEMEFKPNNYPITLDIIYYQLNISGFYYRLKLYNVAGTKYFLQVSMYKFNSSGEYNLTNEYTYDVSNFAPIFKIKVALTSTTTYISIGQIVLLNYAFQNIITNKLGMGIRVYNNSIQLDNIYIRNFYNYIPKTISFSPPTIHDSIKKFGELKRLYTENILIKNFSSLRIIAYDDLGLLLCNKSFRLLENENIIKLPVTKFILRSLSDSYTANVEIISSYISKRFYLDRMDDLELYLKINSTYIINITYSSGEKISLNITINSPIKFSLVGYSLTDILNLLNYLESIQNITLTELRNSTDFLITKINALNITIKSLIGTLDVLMDILNANISEIRSILLLLNTSISDLNTRINQVYQDLGYMKKDLRGVLDNVTLAINILERLEIKSDMNNATLNYIKSLLIDVGNEISNLTQFFVFFNNTILAEINLSKNEIMVFLQKLNGSIEIYFDEIRVDLSELAFNLTQLLINAKFLYTNISALNYTIKELVASINESIQEIRNALYYVNRSLIDAISRIDDIFKISININNTLNELKNGIGDILYKLEALNDSIIAKLDIFMEYINDTVFVKILDEISSLEKSIVYQIENSTSVQYNYLVMLNKILLEVLNPKEIMLVSEYSGFPIDSDVLFIEVNGERYFSNKIAIVGGDIDVRVVDYWGRILWENLTNSNKILIKLPIAILNIINQKFKALLIKIRPIEIVDLYYEALLKPLDIFKLQIPEGKYYIRVEDLNGKLLLEKTLELVHKVTMSRDKEVVWYIILEENDSVTTLNYRSLVYLGGLIGSFFLFIYVVIRKRRRVNDVEEEVLEI